MEENPILSLQHCQSGANIVCLKVPEKCPICGTALDDAPLKIPPFRLPTPFVHSREFPYSVVIKPTVGSFLSDYTKASKLHTGITDSTGIVYDFNEQGVNRRVEGWPQCLAIPVVEENDIYRCALWDVKLQEFVAYDKWLPDRYNEEDNNCYQFVLDFLGLLGVDEILPATGDRHEFCEQMILPHTKRAAQYITVYRRLLQEGVMVTHDVVL